MMLFGNHAAFFFGTRTQVALDSGPLWLHTKMLGSINNVISIEISTYHSPGIPVLSLNDFDTPSESLVKVR